MENQDQTVKHEQWQSFIEEQEKSGLSQRAFCKQKNIKYTAFNYYLNTLRKKKELKPSQKLFTAIQIKKQELPLSLEIRIVIPNGYQCYIPIMIDPVQLKRIMEALLAC